MPFPHSRLQSRVLLYTSIGLMGVVCWAAPLVLFPEPPEFWHPPERKTRVDRTLAPSVDYLAFIDPSIHPKSKMPTYPASVPSFAVEVFPVPLNETVSIYMDGKLHYMGTPIQLSDPRFKNPRDHVKTGVAWALPLDGEKHTVMVSIPEIDRGRGVGQAVSPTIQNPGLGGIEFQLQRNFGEKRFKYKAFPGQYSPFQPRPHPIIWAHSDSSRRILGTQTSEPIGMLIQQKRPK